MKKEEIERELLWHKMRQLTLLDTKNKMLQYGDDKLDFEDINNQISEENKAIEELAILLGKGE